MKVFTPQELEDDLLYDIVDEVKLLSEETANTLIMLSHEPEDRKLLDKVFRSVHTIKGDVALGQMSPLLPLLIATEDILGMMRDGVIQYDSLISDLLLTVFDHVQAFVDDCVRKGAAEYDDEMFSAATDYIAQVNPEQPAGYKALLHKALVILEPSLAEESDKVYLPHEMDELQIDWDSEVEPDLVFFHNIMEPVEQRVDNWQGRSGRQLKLALLLNKFAGNRVDEKQLRAAVYLHDVGMSLLPLALLRKNGQFTDAEIARLRSHVIRGVAFLSEMPHWAEARQFIHQHHERFDGMGYPQGLSGDEITDGAKILALIDAFEAMTHNRAHDVHLKRPMKRAIQEINLAGGSQFCPYWIEVFNKVMASILPR